MPRRNKFIEKKNSVSYKLVHNENGPLQFEENVSKNVFLPTTDKPSKFDEVFKQPIILDQTCSKTEKYPSKGPRPDWDPDVVAALDDDFDFENPDNVIEDDFISKANADCDSTKETNENTDEEEWDTDNSDDFETKSEKAKSRFTQYSLTSAVTNCSENVKTFNERFEKLLETYDDDQIGALDLEDVEGYTNMSESVINELLNSETSLKKRKVKLEEIEIEKSKILEYVETEFPEKFTTVEIRGPIEGDCESVRSSMSSTRYCPKVIRVAQDIKKISTNPSKILKSKLTKGMLHKLNEEIERERLNSEGSESNVTVMSNIRPKHETAEDRKERKRTFKEMKRENRVIKKENKMAFNKEIRKQQIQEINSRRCRGLNLL